MEKSSILGIDIAKDTFDVALIIEQKNMYAGNSQTMNQGL